MDHKMKTQIITTIMALAISVSLSAQIPADWVQLQYEGRDVGFILQQVIEVPGATADELWKNADRFIHNLYKNPEFVIKSSFPPEHIKGIGVGVTSVGIGLGLYANSEYRWSVEVKDGRVRYTWHDLELNTGSGSSNAMYYLMDLNPGMLKGNKTAVRTKEAFETDYNAALSMLKKYIFEGPQATSDW
jgi:hypothetical protein